MFSIVLLGVLAAILVLTTLALLGLRAARRRDQDRKDQQDRWSGLPEPGWLTAEDSPLGRPVVDCRGYCRLMASSPGGGVPARFAAACKGPVSALCGQLPENAGDHPVDWGFTPAQMTRLRAGFHAEVLEDRWLIRHDGGRLYFQRSWTGALVYLAELGPAGISRLWLRRRDAEGPGKRALAMALVRYLVDSHLLQEPAAVPVPEDLAGDPQKMAHFAFSIAGRHGDYAEPFLFAPSDG